MYQVPKPFLFESNESQKIVVMFHGYAGSTNDMRMLSRFLQRNGYATYCNNFAGHATLDPKDILQKNVDDWLQDARDMLSYVRDRGYKEIVVCGLSLGGLIATWMLAECKEIKAGIAISAPYKMNLTQHFYDQFVNYANVTYEAQQIPQLDILKNDVYLRNEVPKQVNQINNLSIQLKNKAENITQKMMLAQGLDDDMIDLTSASLFAKKLKKKPDIFNYSNAGHVLTVNNAHHDLQENVLMFLNDNL